MTHSQTAATLSWIILALVALCVALLFAGLHAMGERSAILQAIEIQLRSCAP